MKDRHVLTVRFCTDGVEGRLYQRLMEGKWESGLSMPDYVKRILTEYFSVEDREEEWDTFLEKFHRECLVVLADILDSRKHDEEFCIYAVFEILVMLIPRIQEI